MTFIVSVKLKLNKSTIKENNEIKVKKNSNKISV